MCGCAEGDETIGRKQCAPLYVKSLLDREMLLPDGVISEKVSFEIGAANKKQNIFQFAGCDFDLLCCAAHFFCSIL